MSTLAFFSPLEEANRLFSEHDYDAAAKAYREVADLDPNNAYAWKGLGLSSAHLGDLQVAASACNQAVALMPGNADLHNAMGYIYIQAKRFTEAIAELDKVLILQPTHEEAKKSIVFALLHEAGNLIEADTSRAAVMLERAYLYEPRNPHVVAPYLECLLRTNQRGKAARLIVDAPEWIKVHELVRPVIAKIRANGGFDQVIQQFEAAEKANVVRPEIISPKMHHSTDTLPCPNCMLDIPFQDEFCPYCGAKVKLGP